MRKALVLGVTMILASCGGSAGDSGEEAMSGGDQSAPTADFAGDISDVGGITEIEFEGQKVIVTGSMELLAADTRSLMNEISEAVRQAGGRVASAEVGPTFGEGRHPEISMVVRIPAGALEAALSEIRSASARVVTERFSTQDVTEEYVDIEARLNNLRTLEEELRTLLSEVRAQPDAEPSQLLEIFNEVSSVRGQIESLEGRQRYLDDQVAFSTMSLFISPLPSSEPIVDEGWQPLVTARDSLRSLVNAFQEIGDFGIRFVIFALPVIVVLTSPFWIAGLLWWRSRKRKRLDAEGLPTEEDDHPNMEPGEDAPSEERADEES